MNDDPKNTFTKLFQKILRSTIWMEDDKTRLVWITMLALADGGGYVMSSVPGLAHSARVDLESCRAAIKKFLEPEGDSGSGDHDGRRIEAVDGGWKLLNHAKYRAMMSHEHRKNYNRIKQQEYRMNKRHARGKPLPGEQEYVAAVQRGATDSELHAIEDKYHLQPNHDQTGQDSTGAPRCSDYDAD